MMNYQELIASKPELFNNDRALLKIITDPLQIESWENDRAKKLKREGKPKSWAEIGVVYEDPYILVLRDLVIFPSGKRGSYFRIFSISDFKGGMGAVVLPVINKKIILLHQFRHSTRKWHWEVPRGFGEPNTTPEENAKKEILEEINGEISKIVNLGAYHSNTGIEGGEVQLYFAELNYAGKVNKDEGIEKYRFVSVELIEKMICNAKITDGFTIAAYVRAKLKGLL